MRLFSLILLLLAFVVAMTLLPLALTRLSYRIYPRSVEDRLWRVLGWACGWPMEGAYWVLSRGADVAVRRGRFALSSRLHAAAERVDPEQFHLTAVAVRRICWPCLEGAAGWWDYTVDCGGHRCRECNTCVAARGGKHLPSA